MTKANKVLEVLRAYSADLQSRTFDPAIMSTVSLLNQFIDSLSDNPRVRLFFGTGGPCIFPEIADCVPHQFRESVAAVKNLPDLQKLSFEFENALQRGEFPSASTEGFWMNTTLHLFWNLSAIVKTKTKYGRCKYCFRTALKNRSICAIHSAKPHSNKQRVAASKVLKQIGSQMPAWMARPKAVLSLASTIQGEIHLADSADMYPPHVDEGDIVLHVPAFVVNLDQISGVWAMLTPDLKVQQLEEALHGFSANELAEVFQIAHDTADWEEFATALKASFQCQHESSKPVLLLIWLTQALLERSLYTLKSPGRKPNIAAKESALILIEELGGHRKRGVMTAVSERLGISRKTLYAWLKPTL